LFFFFFFFVVRACYFVVTDTGFIIIAAEVSSYNTDSENLSLGSTSCSHVMVDMLGSFTEPVLGYHSSREGQPCSTVPSYGHVVQSFPWSLRSWNGWRRRQHHLQLSRRGEWVRFLHDDRDVRGDRWWLQWCHRHCSPGCFCDQHPSRREDRACWQHCLSVAQRWYCQCPW